MKSPSPKVSMKIISVPKEILSKRKKMYSLAGIAGTLTGGENVEPGSTSAADTVVLSS